MPVRMTLTKLLFEPTLIRSPLRVVKWWESRRLAFNVVVGATGVGTLIYVNALELMLGQGWLFGPGAGGVERVLAVGAYGAMANACYTMGWVVEIACRALAQAAGLRSRPGALPPRSRVFGRPDAAPGGGSDPGEHRGQNLRTLVRRQLPGPNHYLQLSHEHAAGDSHDRRARPDGGRVQGFVADFGHERRWAAPRRARRRHDHLHRRHDRGEVDLSDAGSELRLA